MVLLGNKPEVSGFWELAEFVDLNGPHKLGQSGASEENLRRLYAFWAWSRNYRVLSPRDGSVLDVTDKGCGGCEDRRAGFSLTTPNCSPLVMPTPRPRASSTRVRSSRPRTVLSCGRAASSSTTSTPTPMGRRTRPSSASTPRRERSRFRSRTRPPRARPRAISSSRSGANWPAAMRASLAPPRDKRLGLSDIVGATQATRAAIREAFFLSLEEKGWKKFQFNSEYYGSHSEYGEGDDERTYFFHPEIDISRWDGVRFAHGHHSENDENKSFDEWLEGLAEGEHYIEQ